MPSHEPPPLLTWPRHRYVSRRIQEASESGLIQLVMTAV
jgi:hypothetical protein